MTSNVNDIARKLCNLLIRNLIYDSSKKKKN